MNSNLSKIINICGITTITLLFFFTYKETLFWMYGRYTSADSYYSHSFIVPLISVFFIYWRKDSLKKTQQSTNIVGLYIIIFALFLHILGTVLYIFSISGFSIFFLIVGLALYFLGTQVSKLIWFSLLFLIFMFPLPQALIGVVSFPLKIFAAKVGVWVVDSLGVPVHGEGFNIFIPAGHLLVGNPCSGLRSLISFLALGSVLAYMAPLSAWRKWILFLLSIPIAILSNVVRIPILILASHKWGLEAAAPDTFIHTGSGILVFIIGFILLLASARVLEWRN